MTVTSIDLSGFIVANPEHQNETFEAAGAGTTKARTILARKADDGKLIPYVKGGAANGNGVPVAILENDVVAGGAGDHAIRPIVGGKVRKSALIIAADGDDSNIDGAVRDLLRNVGILAVDIADHHVADNQ